MGFLGTGQDILQITGRRLSRYSGLLGTATGSKPADEDEIIQRLTAYADGVFADSVGVLDRPEVCDVNVISLAGTGSILADKAIDGTLQKMTFVFHNDNEWNSTSTIECLFGESGTDLHYILSGAVAGAITDETLSYYDGAGFSYIKDVISVGWRTLVLEWSVDRWEFTLDGTPLTTFKSGAPKQNADFIPRLGARNTSTNPFSGDFSLVQLETEKGVVLRWSSEEADEENTYDTSGRGNNGTIINGTIATTDGIPSHNLEYGFSFGSKYPIITLANSATTYSITSFSDNGNGSYNLGNDGVSFGAVLGLDGGEQPFEESSGKTYKVTLSATGTIPSTLAIRSASNASGAGATGSLNSTLASGETEKEFQFVASSASDKYLQITCRGSEVVDCTLTLHSIEEVGVTEYIPALTEKTKSVGTFDGVGDNIVISQVQTLQDGETFSFVVADVEDLAQADIDLWRHGSRRFLLKQGGIKQFRYYDGVSVKTFGTGLNSAPVFNGEEHTIAVTMDGDDYSLYLDDELVGTAQLEGFSVNAVPSGYFGGQFRNIVAGDFVHDMQVEGKATSVLTTQKVGETVTATINTGAGGLDSFWGVREADADGIIVDAKHYLPIAVGGGYVHNGCEVSIVQTDFGIIDRILVERVVSPDIYYNYDGIYNSRPQYSSHSFTVRYDGSQWEMILIGLEIVQATNPATTTFPPSTGWTTGVGAISISYPSFWVENEEFVKRSWEYILAHHNGDQALYFKSETDMVGALGNCILKETGQYSVFWMPTPKDYIRNSRYWTVCTDFSSALVPAEVVAGTGIGPNGEWADNGDGKVLLVEDA